MSMSWADSEAAGQQAAFGRLPPGNVLRMLEAAYFKALCLRQEYRFSMHPVSIMVCACFLIGKQLAPATPLRVFRPVPGAIRWLTFGSGGSVGAYISWMGDVEKIVIEPNWRTL